MRRRATTANLSRRSMTVPRRNRCKSTSSVVCNIARRFLPDPCHRLLSTSSIMGRDPAQCDGPARLGLESCTARSDTLCDQTNVETANFEVEGFLGITKPWALCSTAVDGEKSGRAAIGVTGGWVSGMVSAGCWTPTRPSHSSREPVLISYSLKVAPEWLGGRQMTEDR